MFITIKRTTILKSAALALLLAALALLTVRRMNYVALPAADFTASGPVLVIDAGHGGADGGAVGIDGTTESGINLDIALKMQALARFCGQETVMTRTSEDIQYPAEAQTIAAKKVADQRARVQLINSLPDAVLISVHQNKYPDPRPRGSQALYAATDGSRELGEAIHANLLALYPENRRVAAQISGDIYLTKNISCPAVLVECGFLSNPEDAALLDTDAYRLKLAVILIGSFLDHERGQM